MPPRLTTEKFLEKVVKVHGDKFDYSKVEYIDGRTPVTLICREHGEFYPWPSTLLRSSGCKKCNVRTAKKTVIEKAKQQFIEKAISIHGGKYDFSSFDYQRSDIKSTVICPSHGGFEAKPNNILSGKGCPMCGRENTARALSGRKILKNKDKLLSLTEAFIKKATAAHDGKYNYSKATYVNTETKLIIICPEHGEFAQRAGLHLKGAGCKKCADIAKGRKRAEGAGRTFVERAHNIHNNRYSYEKAVYVRTSDKVIITCPTHGNFNQTPNAHLGGAGCPHCGTERMADACRIDTPEFIRRARAIHGDYYDYTKVNYIGNKEKIVIICPTHGEFTQTPTGHLNGGCQRCGYKIQGDSVRYTTAMFLADAAKVHGDKYDYSLVTYTGAAKPVTVICREHGHFTTTYAHHVKRKQDCPSCMNRDMDTDKFIAHARAVHGNLYDYSKTNYTKAKSKVIIICPKHGEFEQVAWNHTDGIGCPACVDHLNSKGSRRIEEWLTDNKITFEREKSFAGLYSTKPNAETYRLRFDFFVPSHNLLIEYDGKQHFEPVDIFGGTEGHNRLVANDQRKNQWTIDNDYNLLRIAYYDDDVIEQILAENLLTTQSLTLQSAGAA